MKGCICHFVKWQIHPFISKGSLVILNELGDRGGDLCVRLIIDKDRDFLQEKKMKNSSRHEEM